MAEHRAEVAAVAAGPWPPSFEDTIAALERAGQRLHLAECRFDLTSGALSSPAVRAVEAEMLPRLAAHHDAVAMDPRAFARVDDLAQRSGSLGLDEEQAAVLERYHRDRVRAGAMLGEAEQVRLRAINERLSSLTAVYRDNLHTETRALAVRAGSADELAGLPPAMLEAAARAADGDGYLLELLLPSLQPALEHLHDRELRERLFRASTARARRGGAHDNRPVVSEMAALRAERAGLLGFASHADYALADQTAGTVAAAREVLETVIRAAVPAARAEASRHEQALRADGHEGPLEPWDWPYYAARERQARHAVDEASLRDFFTLDRAIEDGLFTLAGELYGLRFTPRDDLELVHPDVRAWTVSGPDGRERGVLSIDPYARDGKSGGAWLDSYADPAPLIGRPAHANMVLNTTRPADGEPALLTPTEVRTLFHEFGHALHMLLSDVTYPTVAGLNVPHDVVEFPSEFHESLSMEPALLQRYTRHIVTGKTLSAADLTALEAGERDEAPFASLQAAAGSLLDLAWHGLAPGESVAPEDIDAFEDAVLAEHAPGLRAIEHRYRSSFFVHLFDGFYSGTHYSYTWSAMLEATALRWLEEQGGPNPEAGARLRDELLSRGAVVDPLAAFAVITGQAPSVGPLLERRGLG